MGLTSNLQLPYPELSDQANVPVDVKKLADRLEAVLGGPLPNPVGRYVNTLQTVTVTDANAEQAFTPVATIRNPHSLLYLLVAIRMTGWVNTTAAPATNAFYATAKTTGQFASYDSGGMRVQGDYIAAAAEAIATIAPGASLTATLSGHKLNTTGGAVTIQYVRNVITPTGWLKTGAIN